MAAIERRESKGGVSWRAKIRIKGERHLSRTFPLKAQAQQWADEVSSRVRAGDQVLGSADRKTTLQDVVDAYVKSPEHTSKKSAVNEAHRVSVLAVRFGARFMSALRTADVVEYRDERLKSPVHQSDARRETKTKTLKNGALGKTTQLRSTRSRRLAQGEALAVRFVAAQTVVHELNTLSTLFKFAAKSMGIPVENPVLAVTRPKLPPGRDRRLRVGEFEALIAGATAGETKTLAPIITLALETAMRLGELLALEWRDVDLKTGIEAGRSKAVNMSSLLVRTSKIGKARSVPLSLAAVKEFKRLGGHVKPLGVGETIDNDRRGDRVFGQWANSRSFDKTWRRCLDRARAFHAAELLAARLEPDAKFLADWRFHDFRHEGVSRLFEMTNPAWSLPEIMSATGHTGLVSLARYSHARAASSLAAKRG